MSDTIPLIEHQAIVGEMNQRLQERTEGMLNRLQEKTQREGFVPLADHLKATTWQPIETAPKDGTPVLVWAQYGADPAIAYFCRGEWQASCENLGADGSSIYLDAGLKFTHWMPLPEPPTPTSN